MARILITDDDAATRDLLRRALEADGHAVATVADGAEALLRLAESGPPFDLLISDMQMPGLDGIQLAAGALARQPGLRIVLMSGYVDQLERSKELATTRITTLSKPFTLEAARSSVRAALAG